MKQITMIVDGTEYTVSAKSRLDAWKKVEKMDGKDLNTCKTQKELFAEVEEVVKKCSQPYGLNYNQVEESLAKIQAWQMKPSNDCLRARGDFRWLKSCELATSLQVLLEPF